LAPPVPLRQTCIGQRLRRWHTMHRLEIRRTLARHLISTLNIIYFSTRTGLTLT
jgi:hypothetical protein